MKLNIKDLALKMEVGAPGVVFEVKDNDGKNQGEFHVTKGGLVWCKGKTAKKDGKKLTWKKLMDQLEDK